MTKKRSTQKMDEGLQRAVKAAGTRYRLAKLIGIKPTSLLKWREVPIRRVLDVERVTGVDRAILRPDFYRR